MFSNLLKIGISQDTINNMVLNYNEFMVGELDEEYENVFKILNVLKMLKIKNIDSLLISNKNLFLLDYDIFMSKLKDKDLKEISEYINQERNVAIDKIFFDEE